MNYWPANSPDLNVIELLWVIIKKRIDMKKPETIEELKRVITEVWDELGYSTIL